MFVGVGAARVRDLFEQARKAAPCIIFIDELDALGRSRQAGGIGGIDEKEQTLNQLLAELDGFDPSTGVILLAATNRPEILDPALLRAGRFDRQVLVDRPDHKGRFEILKVHVKKIILDPKADLDRIAAMTTGFTGADIANLVNEAAVVATRRNSPQSNFRGYDRLQSNASSPGLEKKSRILTAAGAPPRRLPRNGPCAGCREPPWRRPSLKGLDHPTRNWCSRLYDPAPDGRSFCFGGKRIAESCHRAHGRAGC